MSSLLTNGVLTLILTVLTEYEALSRAFLNDLIQCIANIVRRVSLCIIEGI